MVGTASLLALWILSATPGRGNQHRPRGRRGGRRSVSGHDRCRRARQDEAAAPLPPQRLPPDPAYDAKQPAASNKEGHSRPAAAASADAGRAEAERPSAGRRPKNAG